MNIIDYKIMKYFSIRMNLFKQNIKKKESLKFNVQFMFFKVFMIFTKLENASV